MHPNPAFRREPRQRNLDFARQRGFGQLSVARDGKPLAAYVPFVLTEAGDIAELHLLRSNPVALAADTQRPALLSVSGPDSYFPPD